MINSQLYTAPNPSYPVHIEEQYLGKIKIGNQMLNALELMILGLGLVMLFLSSFWGLATQASANEDKQRDFDLQQIVVPALIDFYKNSAVSESDRKYPTSNCSLDANEVDYESTLKSALTGRNEKLDNWAYIPSKDFPTDRQGSYSETLGSRPLPFRCPNILNNDVLSDKNHQIYKDGKSCNFARSNNKYKKCYLYSTNVNGDTYTLAYFSEAKNCFKVLSQTRNRGLNISQECK